MLKYLWPTISWAELNERLEWLARQTGDAFALKTRDDRYAITDEQAIVERLQKEGWRIIQRVSVPYVLNRRNSRQG